MTDILIEAVVAGLAIGVIILLVILRIFIPPVPNTQAKAKAKVTKLDKKKKKALEELRAIKNKAKVPELPPPALKPDAILPSPPQPITGLEQIPIPRKIDVELTRIRDGKRAIVRRGKATLVPRLMNNQGIFFFWVGKNGYFIDPAKIITVQDTVRGKTVTREKLVYDVFNSEPLDSNGGLTYSWLVEKLLVDSAMDQYITVATFEGSFQLTPQLIKILIVVGLLGSFMGLAINGAAHLVPVTVINWVP